MFLLRVYLFLIAEVLVVGIVISLGHQYDNKYKEQGWFHGQDLLLVIGVGLSIHTVDCKLLF